MTLISVRLCIISSDTSPTGLKSSITPALLTKISSLPYSRQAKSIMPSDSSFALRSAAWGMIFPG